MKRISLAALLVFVLIFVFMSAVQAQSPQETLKQYISDLQKNPNDNALREKIIKYVQTMSPSPNISEEARRHYVMAKTLFDEAKKAEDFNESIAEFRNALLIAPWWSEANRQIGLALEAARRYDEAVTYIKLYMATNPGDERIRAAQDELYKIEAKKKLLAREKADTAAKAASEARAKAEAEAKARLESVEGTWCHFSRFRNACDPSSSSGLMKIQRLTGTGWTINYPNWDRMYAYDIRVVGQTISFTTMIRESDPELNTAYLILSLSPGPHMGSSLYRLLKN